MTANTKNKYNHSARRKLIPAIAMLTVSAMTLASSTYAWFTMSKEVEVKNIQMTATVPEDIQISLGAIGSASETNSLAKNGGFLTANAPASDYDWSNIADISNYYAFGKLIPASSTTGLNVFFTPDASGVGRTMKTGATFYQAAAGKTATNESGLGTGAGSKTLAATAHLYESAADKVVATGWLGVGYTASTAWNNTGDDGYYIDIPVWLRTSSSNQQPIYVYGFASDRSDTDDTANDTDDLYKAVRVAILGTSLSDDTTPVESYVVDQGCLTLADGGATYSEADDDTERAGKYPGNGAAANILDSDNYNGDGTNTNRSGTPASGRHDQSASGIYAVSGLGSSSAGAWDTITSNNAVSGKTVATLAAGSGATFGTPTKLIIRVWLEGEDGNCWNANAGQDWNISLRFSKDPLPAGT